MNAWTIFWGAVLIASLAIFACVAVVVTIGGMADIRAMLRRLGRERERRRR